MLLYTSMLLYTITPILGLLRNFIKYKQLNYILFFRSPLIYYCINYSCNIIQYNNTIYETLIYERWIMFIIKSIISLYKNDYNSNKLKYMKKYNIKYE